MIDPIASERDARWRTYFIALGITGAIFATAFFASDYFNNQRMQDIRAAQDDISTDILSIETQFDLLQQYSCENVAENTILPGALSSLGSQLSYMETQGGNVQEVVRLKRMYSLLQIKDYLLMQQLAQKCGLKPVFILYFYSNEGDCEACRNQGFVLTALAQRYPQLRIYSFDYNLDLSALQTLVDINKIENRLPALHVKGKTYYGLQKLADIEKILPELATLKKATSTPEVEE